MTGYTSNGRTAALMALMFFFGLFGGLEIVHPHLYLWFILFVLLLVIFWVIGGEHGPDDPPKRR